MPGKVVIVDVESHRSSNISTSELLIEAAVKKRIDMNPQSGVVLENVDTVNIKRLLFRLCQDDSAPYKKAVFYMSLKKTFEGSEFSHPSLCKTTDEFEHQRQEKVHTYLQNLWHDNLDEAWDFQALYARIGNLVVFPSQCHT